ncbi:tetratricopeptide repeat-containing sensor histidine kinase [Taibaiella koreensis]|uniref:tetratricopeptide repeat-containing sensor histidine kinase n=1 Tax=Taibaiella koreensis TaxID=1268548 RepID=UPI000E59DCB0|nr:tetratricopeptide repeat protein [Taibaiella koreensis]
MKKAAIILGLLSNMAFARQENAKDSLQRLIAVARQDTATVSLYYSYGALLEEKDGDSALYYYRKAQQLAQAIGYRRGEAAYAGNAITVLNNKGQFRKALDDSKKALEIYKQIGSPRDLAVANLNVGSEWQYLSDFNAAAAHYLESKKYAEQIADIKLQRLANNNLAAVFLSLAQFEKAKQYAQRALQYAQQLKDDMAVASSLYNLATAAVYLKQYDTALVLFHKIENIAGEQHDDISFLDAWLGKAGVYSGQNNSVPAAYYFDKVIALSRQKQVPEYEMYAYMGKADLYIQTRNFALAEKAIQQGLQLAIQLETKYERKDLLLKAATLNEHRGNYKVALAYQKQAQALNDSIIGEKNQTVISNNEARYEFEKNQAAIKSLQADKKLYQLTLRQHKSITLALGIGALLLLLLALLIYRNIKNKQKIQKQRIAELEREKKLTASEAILKGEEQERSRLAKDLHDGLGGMLSGIKHSLGTIKASVAMEAEQGKTFDYSIHMLDHSITEMRRVAHNMMPESLTKFGLDAALSDFCNQLSVSGVVAVSYLSMGLEKVPVEHSLAITVYRIVQELLNNAIKHASARKVMVQATREAGLLTLTVEDDGKGFDVDALKTAEGIGWKNIRSRLDYHNGKLHIQSAPSVGTSVFIEFIAR